MTNTAYQLGVQHALARLMKCAFSWGGAPAGPLSPMREDQLQSPGELANKAPPPGKVTKPHVTGSRALNLNWGKQAALTTGSSTTGTAGRANGEVFGDIPGAFAGSLISGHQTPAAAAGAPPAADPAGGSPLSSARRSGVSSAITTKPSTTGGIV